MNPRHLINGVVLAAILAVAALVQHTSPGDGGWQQPMEVSGQLGGQVAGRNIAATVWGAQVAHEVRTSDWAGETTGIWVVVDVSAEAVVDEFAARLGMATLAIGDETFSASERPDLDTIYQNSLTVGIPTRGPLFFEIPTDALRDARLQLGIDSDPRLDSLLVIPLDLSSLTIADSLTTDDVQWGVE